jgi:hypothetical protein
MRLRIAPLLAATCLMFAAAPTLAASQPTTPTPTVSPPSPIRHVFIIVLENEDYATIFGAGTPSPYLGHDLVAQGALATNYYATGHSSLDNYITMISGQPPDHSTRDDCGVFTEFALSAPLGADGIAAGEGCFYPKDVHTIADQLDDAHLTWRAYMEDMGNDTGREARVCARPDVGKAGAPRATPTDSYAYRHNPFVYFHSVADRPACAANDVRLEQLTQDLASVATTPNYAFIVPGVCHDGHDKPNCADGSAGGLPAADAWLKIWVPKILNSPAFKKDGLLIVTFDEAAVDASACCNEPAGPNVHFPGRTGPGGGRIGAVLLSRFIKPGTVLATPINHYGMLRSVEDIFGLSYLGYAADPALATFAPAWTAP